MSDKHILQAVRPSQAAEILRLCLPIRKPVSLLSGPGVGKSSIVKQVAAAAGYRVIDIRLAQMDPVDLRGVPSVVGGRTVFHPPDCFPFADKVGSDRVVLFFDEFTQSPIAVQNAALEPLLDRTLGGVPLGENVVVVAAGNRVEDRAGANKLTTAAASRFLTHLDLEPNLDDWQAWSVQAGIWPAVRSFLRVQPNFLLAFDPAENPRSFPCPRTWENVSDLCKVGMGSELGFLVYRGAVGEAAAAAFIAHEKICDELQDPEEVLRKPDKAEVPTKPAVMYGLAAALVEAVRQQDTPKRVGSLMAFIERMKPEFGLLTFRDCMDAKIDITSNPAAQKFCLKHKDVVMRTLPQGGRV